MLVLEAKIYGKQAQYNAVDEAIRTGQFIRNKALRYWMDNKGVGKYQLSAYCKVLAAEFPFAHKVRIQVSGVLTSVTSEADYQSYGKRSASKTRA